MTELTGTNLELFGSEFEYKIKEESAKFEEVWLSIDVTKPGIYIWKVDHFHLRAVPTNNYGIFYEGDSYVVLYIQQDTNQTLKYTIHFWLGKETTADEMGTAAYKTVELDTFLKGRAVQMRETQGNESELFRSYFLRGIVYNTGGVESGFNKVNAFDYNNYQPLLYRVHNNSVNQVPLTINSLTQDDVFILDSGLSIYIYTGGSASHKERLLAQYAALNIKECRKDCLIFDVTPSNNDQFLNTISKDTENYTIANLYKIQEVDNVTSITQVQGPITYESFDTHDAFTFSIPQATFVWIGKESSYNEMLNAWRVAIRVAEPTSTITLVKEGLEPEVFKMCL